MDAIAAASRTDCTIQVSDISIDKLKQIAPRLTYKESQSSQRPVVRTGSPRQFECPRHLIRGDDYCFDLAGLTRGQQYTANVVYQLRDGTWSEEDSPAFFILVESSTSFLFLHYETLLVCCEYPLPAVHNPYSSLCVAEDAHMGPPTRFQVKHLSPSAIHLSWLPPLGEEPVDHYRVPHKHHP